MLALPWARQEVIIGRVVQVDSVRRVDANDLDEHAATAVRRNLEYNDPKASGIVRPLHGDVRLVALQVQIAQAPCS